MSVRLFQICFFVFNTILLGGAWAEMSYEKPTSVIISNNYISGIIGVVLKDDGSVIIGTDDKMHQFDLYEIPVKFLKGWNINVEEALEKYELITENLWQNSIKKEQDQKAMGKDIKARYPNIKFPLVAEKNIFEYELEIQKGEKFTLIPYQNEIGEFYLKVVVQKASGDWYAGIKKRGITQTNLGKIDADFNVLSNDAEGWHKLVREKVNGRRIQTYTDSDGKTFRRYVPNIFNNYFVETNFKKNVISHSYVVCFLESRIDETFSVRDDARKYIGNDDKYNFGEKASGKKLLIFSSDGTIGYHRVD